MGRSVSYPTGALVCFEDVSAFEDEFDFEWFADDLKARSRAMFPSLYEWTCFDKVERQCLSWQPFFRTEPD
jgi:hypothetical protein